MNQLQNPDSDKTPQDGSPTPSAQELSLPEISRQEPSLKEPAPQEPSAQNRFTRLLRKFGLPLTALGLAGLAVSKHWHESAVGTLDSPLFGHVIPGPNTNQLSYFDYLDQRILAVQAQIERLKGLDPAEVRSRRDSLVNLLSTDDTAGLSDREFISRCNQTIVSLAESTGRIGPHTRVYAESPKASEVGKNDAEFRARNGHVLELADKLFVKTTCKSPIGCVINVDLPLRDLALNKVSGFNLGFIGVTLVERRNYVDQLLTTLHERGHQISPIGEASVFELQEPEFGILSREEAVAYTFTAICISNIEDPELRKACERSFQDSRAIRIKKYLAGSNEEHARGMALADAALSLYSPEVAWEKLVAGRKIDQAILKRLADGKHAASQVTASEKALDEAYNGLALKPEIDLTDSAIIAIAERVKHMNEAPAGTALASH